MTRVRANPSLQAVLKLQNSISAPYIAGNSSDLLVISQLCGYLIFYGGARKLERVLSGRALVERALRQRPQAPYVIHGYAHILHDQGKPEESLDLLRNRLNEHRRSAEGGAMWHRFELLHGVGQLACRTPG